MRHDDVKYKFTGEVSISRSIESYADFWLHGFCLTVGRAVHSLGARDGLSLIGVKWLIRRLLHMAGFGLFSNKHLQGQWSLAWSTLTHHTIKVGMVFLLLEDAEPRGFPQSSQLLTKRWLWDHDQGMLEWGINEPKKCP